jgi:hypothetical protein
MNLIQRLQALRESDNTNQIHDPIAIGLHELREKPCYKQTKP